MAEKNPVDTQDKDDTTIARPIKSLPNHITFKFTHRQMWSINTYSEQYKTVQINPSDTAAGAMFYRNQFRILPIKSLAFFASPGEQAILLQFTHMKFKRASINMHTTSFRSQFVTGSTAVGFANSNMQLHGYLFDEEENMPPYNIYLNGQDPVAADAVSGPAIGDAIWPGYASAPTATTNSLCQFDQLPWVPWLFGGLIQTTNPAAAKVNMVDTYNNQIIYPMIQRAELIGRKVTDISREYELEKAWGGQWLPIRPHWAGHHSDVPQNWSSTAPNTFGGMVGTVYGLLYQYGGADMGNSDGFRNMWITPPNEYFNLVQAIGDPLAAATISYRPTDGAAQGRHVHSFYPDPTKGAKNLFLGVEHLINQDDSIVPAIWDFYLDTEIEIECKWDYGNYVPGALHITRTPTDAVGVYESNILPFPYSAIANDDRHTRFTRYNNRVGATFSGSTGNFADSGFGMVGMHGQGALMSVTASDAS